MSRNRTYCSVCGGLEPKHKNGCWLTETRPVWRVGTKLGRRGDRWGKVSGECLLDRDHPGIETVNELLRLDAVPTIRGDEVKFWRHDGEGGRCKGYLTAAECGRLADAFGNLALYLREKP